MHWLIAIALPMLTVAPSARSVKIVLLFDTRKPSATRCARPTKGRAIPAVPARIADGSAATIASDTTRTVGYALKEKRS
jgi:hypothetical protein